MVSYEELQFEWSMLCQDCTECWTKSDLQLAAELGKTLLERNKELENSLKNHQTLIEDQTQEIEYLTKQTVALREVNDSRLRIYEQLEVSIHDLERANHRLVLENSNDKKQIKNLTLTIENLECKCEELQVTIDDLTSKLNVVRRTTKTQEATVPVQNVVLLREVDAAPQPNVFVSASNNVQKAATTVNAEACQNKIDTDSEQLNQLLAQLKESRTLFVQEQRRANELEEQLSSMVQQNDMLERQVVLLRDEEPSKSMHEELITLEEVRQGQLCSRCLRSMDSPGLRHDSSCLEDEQDDDLDTFVHRTSFHMDVQDVSTPLKPPSDLRQESNLYKNLVEKYEALLKVQRDHKSSERLKDADEESGRGDSLKSTKKDASDFSEAETASSSGFADETSNKTTQTDERPGSLLWAIADGDDCKFSIYDDASPVASRFQSRPEYRQLFTEIFGVLKKAAEDKTELPPPPDVESPPSEDIFPADSDVQSVVSSEFSVNPSEPPETKDEPQLMPYVRQPLEYLSVAVNVRKRSASRRKKQRDASPVTPILGSPKITYANRPGRKRHEIRRPEWNGNTMHFYSRNAASSPTPSGEYTLSTASQDLIKLKKLDLSYAEVLRNADKKKKERRQK